MDRQQKALPSQLVCNEDTLQRIPAARQQEWVLRMAGVMEEAQQIGPQTGKVVCQVRAFTFPASSASL